MKPASTIPAKKKAVHPASIPDRVNLALQQLTPEAFRQFLPPFEELISGIGTESVGDRLLWGKIMAGFLRHRLEKFVEFFVQMFPFNNHPQLWAFALLEACWAGDTVTITTLRANGVTLQPVQMNPLIPAIIRNDTQAASIFINLNPAFARMPARETVLMVAVSFGRVEILEILLRTLRERMSPDKFAEFVNLRSESGSTALGVLAPDAALFADIKRESLSSTDVAKMIALLQQYGAEPFSAVPASNVHGMDLIPCYSHVANNEKTTPENDALHNLAAATLLQMPVIRPVYLAELTYLAGYRHLDLDHSKGLALRLEQTKILPALQIAILSMNSSAPTQLKQLLSEAVRITSSRWIENALSELVDYCWRPGTRYQPFMFERLVSSVLALPASTIKVTLCIDLADKLSRAECTLPSSVEPASHRQHRFLLSLILYGVEAHDEYASERSCHVYQQLLERIRIGDYESFAELYEEAKEAEQHALLQFQQEKDKLLQVLTQPKIVAEVEPPVAPLTDMQNSPKKPAPSKITSYFGRNAKRRKQEAQEDQKEQEDQKDRVAVVVHSPRK